MLSGCHICPASAFRRATQGKASSMQGLCLAMQPRFRFYQCTWCRRQACPSGVAAGPRGHPAGRPRQLPMRLPQWQQQCPAAATPARPRLPAGAQGLEAALCGGLSASLKMPLHQERVAGRQACPPADQRICCHDHAALLPCTASLSAAALGAGDARYKLQRSVCSALRGSLCLGCRQQHSQKVIPVCAGLLRSARIQKTPWQRQEGQQHLSRAPQRLPQCCRRLIRMHPRSAGAGAPPRQRRQLQLRRPAQARHPAAATACWPRPCMLADRRAGAACREACCSCPCESTAGPCTCTQSCHSAHVMVLAAD